MFQDVYIHMAKSSFELLFPLWGFSPLFPSQRSSKRLSSACASHWTLPFLRLDSLLIEKGPDILTSRFHPNRLKTKPARENQRIRLQRQHCLFYFSKQNQALALVRNGPETLPTKSHPNRLKTKVTRQKLAQK